MPTGIICQLSYHGGGLLRFDSVGVTNWVPFAAADHLHIGQRVSFQVKAGEAVGLEVESRKRPELTEYELTSAKPLPQGSQPKWLQRLQRRILRFRNANVSERLEMLRRAEEWLDTLLNSTEVDGDALCRLVRRCAAWLCKLRLDGKDLRTSGGSESCGNVQRRVRKLLISALSHLDLSDPQTYAAVEVAVTYLKDLMQAGCNAGPGGTELRNATKQWQRLASLIGLRQELPRSKISAAAKAGVSEGVYYPSKRVKELDAVFHSAEAVLLQCPTCPKQISSSWYFRHPKTQEIHFLTPSKGHSACNNKFGKRCYLRALDGRRTVLDNFKQLDFCRHQRRRAECKHCGALMCCHQRLLWRCAVCKMPGLEKKKKTVKL